MGLNGFTTLYDVLETKPDASPQEIRDAYLRVKGTYNRDSVALYSLITGEEREQMLRSIEEAYSVLSNPGKRKQYDRSHGFLDPEQDFSPQPSSHQKIISIDRVPPMESAEEGDELLVPPSTDFVPSGDAGAPKSGGTVFADTEAPLSFASGRKAPQVTDADRDAFAPVSPVPTPPPPVPQAMRQPPPMMVDAALAQAIAQETEWRGSFLKKVREAKKLSIEELAGATRVSKSYLIAIEEENFGKLPAAVFLRGFIVQIARALKLPQEKASAAYMERFFQAKPEKR